MMSTVKISRLAARSMRYKAAWLRKRNPQAANDFLDAMKRARQLLARYPQAGAPNDLPRLTGERRLICGDFAISYDINKEGTIVIHNVRHGRELGPLLDPDDDPEAE